MTKLTPEQAQQVVEMIPTARSFREIARAIGARLDSVRAIAVPVATFMRLAGTLEPCDCGKPRFHPYSCSGEHNILRKKSIRPPVSPELLARRELAIEMLTAGMPYRHIDDALGASHGSARSYVRFLTPEQCAQRVAALEASKWKRAKRRPEQISESIVARQKARNERRAKEQSHQEWRFAA